MDQVWSQHACPKCGAFPTLTQKIGLKVVDLCAADRCDWIFMVLNYQPSLLHWVGTLGAEV